MLQQLVRRFARAKGHEISSRTDLINHLLTRLGGRAYLEIGVRDRRHNFDKISADVKHGVDPAPRRAISHTMTSDAFFEGDHAATYDVIFIDGLHLAEQVERDIANSLRVLNPRGAIVLHDCNPLTLDAQTDDYDGKKHWNGTVWKAWIKYRATRSDLWMRVVDVDEGCGVIRRGTQEPLTGVPSLEFESLRFDYLEANRLEALRLVSPDRFVSDFDPLT